MDELIIIDPVVDQDEFDKKRQRTADNVNKMSLVQLRNFIVDWGKIPEGKKSIYKNLVYKGSLDGILKYKFNLAKDLFLKRRLKYRRLLAVGLGGGLFIGGGTVTGSTIGITTAVQHSKNSKRTETKNGIVNNNLN